MYDKFLYCNSCDTVLLTSKTQNSACPYCGAKEFTHSFLYLNENNLLIASLKEYPYPSPLSRELALKKV